MTTTINQSDFSLTFLGTGSGGHLEMGSAAACIEINNTPSLLIDCGPGTLSAFHAQYQALPSALFISHCHMDHIADLEILTVRATLANASPIPLYVPLSIISTLHQRLATYPGTMAEGGHNFWSAFQLIPVTDQFLHAGCQYRCYPTRHHAPGSSYSLHLPGHFFYSGDTRPIPEIVNHYCTANEKIFHDCGVIANPSHTGLDDLKREYSASVLERFCLYHYASATAAEELEQHGWQVARPGQTFSVSKTN